MRTLATHTKKLVGLLVAMGALVAVAAPSAFAEPAYSVGDRTGQAEPAIDASLLRDRSTDRGHLGSGSLQLNGPVSGIERVLVSAAVGQNDPSMLRDRSTDRGSVGGQIQAPDAPVVEADSGDGFQWNSLGIRVGTVLGLMLLAIGTTFMFRRSRHQPKRA